MRRIVSFILCFIMIASIGMVMYGCDNSTVTITMNNKYENELADKFASEKSIDDNGNVVYKFTKPDYLDYLESLMDKVRSEFRDVILDTATYSYLNEDGTELVVGVDDAVYNEESCKKQANEIGNLALIYNASTLDHTGKVTVTYENNSTGIEYFKTNIEA